MGQDFYEQFNRQESDHDQVVTVLVACQVYTTSLVLLLLVSINTSNEKVSTRIDPNLLPKQYFNPLPTLLNPSYRVVGNEPGL
jgi:hypothetical protein